MCTRIPLALQTSRFYCVLISMSIHFFNLNSIRYNDIKVEGYMKLRLLSLPWMSSIPFLRIPINERPCVEGAMLSLKAIDSWPLTTRIITIVYLFYFLFIGLLRVMWPECLPNCSRVAHPFWAQRFAAKSPSLGLISHNIETLLCQLLNNLK